MISDPSASAARPTPLGRPARMAWLIGGGLLALVTLAHPSATRMHTWPWALPTALLWLLPLALFAIQLARSPSWRLPGPLVSLGLALLALVAVIAAWTSPYFAPSLVRTWPTLGGVALGLLLHHWLTASDAARSARVELVGRFVGWGGAILVAVSLAGWLRGSWPVPWLSRNGVPFGHSNYTGGLMVLLIPWLVLRAASTRGAGRIGWITTSLAALLVVAGTSSRGAALALAVEAALAASVLIAVAPWPARRKVLFAATALAVAAVTILANPRLRDLAFRQTWGESARESNRQRTAMIDAGLRLGAQRPVLGWGPGTVPLAYPRVRATLDGGVDNVLQLHATPLQIWATLGSAGLLAIGLLIAGTGVAIFRALRQRDRSLPACAAAASLVGYSLFAFTDHAFDLPIVVGLVATLLALLTSTAAPGPDWSLARLQRLIVLLHVFVLVGGPAFALGRDLLARRIYDQGVTAWEQREPSEFLAALDRATKLTPYDPFFLHHAANQFLSARGLMPDAASKLELTKAAVAKLESALRTSVHEELAHFNLGWLKLDLDDPRAAARHFNAAVQLVPDKGGAYFGLGLALQAAGKTDDAVRAFALEWINDPRSLTSPAWEIPLLAPLRSAVQAETLKLYAQLRTKDARAAQAEAWTRWWLGENMSSADLTPAFTEEAEGFAAALPAIASRSLVTDAAWSRPYAAWLRPDVLEPWQRLAPGEPALAAALQRRALQHRDDFRAFLSAPIGDEPALARTYRRQRIGYGVLALHPDGPPITDAYIVQENGVVADVASALFPPKGWLPGRFLLALLPPNPR